MLLPCRSVMPPSCLPCHQHSTQSPCLVICLLFVSFLPGECKRPCLVPAISAVPGSSSGSLHTVEWMNEGINKFFSLLSPSFLLCTNGGGCTCITGCSRLAAPHTKAPKTGRAQYLLLFPPWAWLCLRRWEDRYPVFLLYRGSWKTGKQTDVEGLWSLLAGEGES